MCRHQPKRASDNRGASCTLGKTTELKTVKTIFARSRECYSNRFCPVKATLQMRNQFQSFNLRAAAVSPFAMTSCFDLTVALSVRKLSINRRLVSPTPCPRIHGCESACSAVIRFSGFSTRRFATRSRAVAETSLRLCQSYRPREVRLNDSSSESPTKGGLPVRRMKRITPIDHMSTASPYPHASLLSRMISGAMYPGEPHSPCRHVGPSAVLAAKPKSAMQTLCPKTGASTPVAGSSVRSRFSSLRSRWQICLE
mmetsp:Transcript_873/g.2185  ORF Transcript_873/g.2185 Transcript_873/m.2185 type:complete len:255 (-) Transcript_873:796-1560(-)